MPNGTLRCKVRPVDRAEELAVTDLRLAGKVAVVTGAGQGVGRGIATALARNGASVVLAGRTKSKCDEVAAQVSVEGGIATSVQCDVSNRCDVNRAVDYAVQSYSGLDVLVNNVR
jgi:NAD(P)-dependent dehydrogenase (short-subunit alcohol dehydrogenase family)